MNKNKPLSALERNLGRLLKASAEQPETTLSKGTIHSVLEEVRRERTARRGEWWRSRAAWWSFGVAAAVILGVLIHWGFLGSRPGTAGEVRAVYGLVALQERRNLRDLSRDATAPPGAWEVIQPSGWVRTHWGSQAEMRLADRSRLLSHSRTSIRLESGRKGEKILMQEGWLSVEAAKQAPGKELRIETPSARISVLGTRFDVRLVQKPNGRKQTRVSVTSGLVNLESARSEVLLPPNTEGIADEGRPPERRCLTPEVNELVRLITLNERLAREKGLQAGTPSLIEFHSDATATVWLILSLRNSARGDSDAYTFQLKEETGEVAAYTLEGTPLEVRTSGRRVEVRAGGDYAKMEAGRRIILKLRGVKGLFAALGKGTFEYGRAGDDPSVLSLYQFRLPESALLEEIKPQAIETAEFLTRQVITLAVRAQPLGMVD